jgi:hypothetical protein
MAKRKVEITVVVSDYLTGPGAKPESNVNCLSSSSGCAGSGASIGSKCRSVVYSSEEGDTQFEVAVLSPLAEALDIAKAETES